MSSSNYPSFPRLDGEGWCCDYVVHNKTEGEIYFYSRIVGVELCKENAFERAISQVAKDLNFGSRLLRSKHAYMHYAV